MTAVNDQGDQLTRDDLPDDTIDVLEALASGLGMTRGRHYLKIEFRDGRYDNGSREEILTRSAVAGHDAARIALRARRG